MPEPIPRNPDADPPHHQPFTPRPNPPAGQPNRPFPRPANRAQVPPVHVVRGDLSAAMFASFGLVLAVSVVASVIGCIWAATSVQTVSGSTPYLQGLGLLGLVSVSTGIPAVAISWIFDVFAWRQGRHDFAIYGWPSWHQITVATGAIVGAILLVFLPRTGNHFGPPKSFWWIAPSFMLVLHGLCLLARASDSAADWRVT